MKRVFGSISSRPLGSFDFEFYVEDDVTEEEIRTQIDDMAQFHTYFNIEEGYEEVQEITYRKKR